MLSDHALENNSLYMYNQATTPLTGQEGSNSNAAKVDHFYL